MQGATLREWIAQTQQPLSAVLDVALQTASALRAAHSAGIVHRDVKPENILIRHDGLVKVVDFGLAKLGEDSQQSSPASALRTRTGIIMGTPSYMSPEQARGLTVDARSDIFSFGVVLFEMLAGRRPAYAQRIVVKDHRSIYYPAENGGRMQACRQRRPATKIRKRALLWKTSH